MGLFGLRPWYDAFSETLLRSTDNELDYLELHTNELLSGIYSCGIESIRGARAD